MSVKKDTIPLASGVEVKRGEGFLNDNILVIGATGSGKTTSITYPRIMSTYESSLIIPIVKDGAYFEYKKMLENRGYTVHHLSFKSPKESTIGYDPLLGKTKEEDIVSLAEAIVRGRKGGMMGDYDPYWENAAISAIGALMMLSTYLSKNNGSFGMFLNLFKRLRVNTGSIFSTNLDDIFDEMEENCPEASAPGMWKTFVTNAPKTASCIYSIMSSSVDKLGINGGFDELCKKKPFDIRTVGKKKTALFISTSSSVSSKIASGIFYGDAIKSLMDEAEKQGGTLPVPVQILADDFACGSTINDFDRSISLFRQAGISATIILQSLSQLESIYGRASAQTIRDNCDTIVFFGSTDIETCKVISTYLDIPLQDVFKMPPEKCAVIRRGSDPVIKDRCPMAMMQCYENEI